MSVFIGEKNKRVELAERKDAINPNLLSNTASFKGFTVANTTTAVSPSKDKLDPLGHVTSHATSTWQQAVNFLDIDTSSAYTLSAFIWLNGDQTIKAICRNSTGVGACSNNGTVINGIKSNCWQRISFTFQGFSESHVAFDFEVTDGTVDFWLGSYKLEKGPVATDWCPAYDDYASNSDFSSLQNTINQLKGRQTVDAPDFNTLTDSGIYLVSNPDKGKNNPATASWGELAVFKGNSSGITQIYSANDNTYVRTYWFASTWSSWNQIAWKSDITNLQNTIQADKTANKTDVTNLANRVTALENQKPIKADSQADAVAKSQSSSNEYYW